MAEACANPTSAGGRSLMAKEHDEGCSLAPALGSEHRGSRGRPAAREARVEQGWPRWGAACQIFGLEHSPERFAQTWIRPHTPIKRLHLTGQDVLFCGVASAVMPGALTAASVLGPAVAPVLADGYGASRAACGLLLGSEPEASGVSCVGGGPRPAPVHAAPVSRGADIRIAGVHRRAAPRPRSVDHPLGGSPVLASVPTGMRSGACEIWSGPGRPKQWPTAGSPIRS